MKLFLDTAHIDHIRTARDWGLLDGVTTNPTLAAKEGLEFDELIARICEITPGPVSAEVVAPDVDGMLEQARRLSAIADNVVVKVPMSKEGVSAGARMVEAG
ncbi:MAG TPA: transaldolase family protein, partial [Acidimicrobiia bacterium]|nr:transaldolase family protein [Acidimicrobiia bacterium]